jgi:hypothetical protein
MKKISVILFLGIIISSCSTTKKFVILNELNEEVEISFLGKKKGVIDPNERFIYEVTSSPPINIEGKSKNMIFSIRYVTKKTDSTTIGYNYKTNMFVENKHILYKDDRGKEIELVDLSIRILKDEPLQLTGNFGYIKLTSNEEDVEIYLDGVFIGLISNTSLNKKIPEGKHSLMAKKEFFMPTTIKFEISNNSIFPYNFELKTVKGWIEEEPGQSVTIQARGNLTVVTEKSDFMVFIEGIKKEPPFELKNMPAGKYNLKIKCSDFIKDIEIIVPDGKTEFIDLDKLFPRGK